MAGKTNAVHTLNIDSRNGKKPYLVPTHYGDGEDGAISPPAQTDDEAKEKKEELAEGEGESVLKPWVQKLSFKEQRILMSAFRGADQSDDRGHMKAVIRMVRQATQVDDRKDNDGAEHYLSKKSIDELNDKIDLKELRQDVEHRSVHFFAHMMEALCIVSRECGEPFTTIYETLLEKMVMPLYGSMSDDAL